MITMSGTLPAGDGNGLEAILTSMLEDPHGMHVAICIVDTAKVTRKTDTDETVPTARIRRIEVIQDREDRIVAEKLMRRALDTRCGREALPYLLEEELRGVYDAPLPDNEDEDGQ